ncbi:hypothetical protein [Aliivibrio fischeri]|uniref:competence protein CoiA family protein n=1 Tax=Aliivibrio fischeri TaxID=668 RepID=UPI0007C4A0D2|nr:hypothetical protein [Aliivibrio fischeri]
MNTIEKHNVWELNVDGFKEPVLASFLIDYMSAETQDEYVSQSILKSHIAKQSVEGNAYVRCGSCDCPVNLIARNATTEAYFRHVSSKAPNLEIMQLCSFYTGSESFFGPGDIYKGEGQWHFKTKHFLAEKIKNTGDFKNIEIEKFIFSKDPEVDARRKPDIAFEDHNGNRFVIELTRWWMNPEVVYKRERFFREQAINLIWLFSPTCEESNSTTMNMILYGSASSRKDMCPDVLSNVECNVFILSDAALLDMQKHNRITFDVLYPIARFDEQSQEIVVEKHQELMNINSLNLEPENRLPFSIKTSNSFQEAIRIKKLNKRQLLAAKYRALRALAYNELTLCSEEDELKCLNIINSAATTSHLTMKNQARLTKYVERAKFKVTKAKSDRLTKIRRKEVAADIRNYRKVIRCLLSSIQSAKYLKDVLIFKGRITNIYHSSTDYHSDPFLAFFKRINSQVERKLAILQEEENNANLSNQKSMRNHDKEMNAFTAELELGFDDVVADLEMFNIKKNRIIRDAKKYGFTESAENLERVYNKAMANAQKAYWNNEYPNLSQGWSYNLRYKPELDKALELKSLKPERRNPKKKQIEAYQSNTHILLMGFLNQLHVYVDSIYTAMLNADQPTLSSLVLHEHKHLIRAKNCLEYLKANQFTVSCLALSQLEVMESCVFDVNNGVPLYSVIVKLHESQIN